MVCCHQNKCDLVSKMLLERLATGGASQPPASGLNPGPFGWSQGQTVLSPTQRWCHWKMVGLLNYTLELLFRWPFFSPRDGPDQNSPQLGVFSGNTALETAYSSTNQVLLKFHSDFSNGGFFVLNFHGQCVFTLLMKAENSSWILKLSWFFSKGWPKPLFQLKPLILPFENP